MKSYLVDTHCLLWSLYQPEKLSKSGREAFLDTQVNLILSAVVTWEISIKESLRKFSLPKPWQKILSGLFNEEGFSPLSIEHSHAIKAGTLPYHHNDPFDRLLIAQSLVENIPIMTADPQFKKYDVKLLWAGNVK
jgi:PIN domain nuclease of toxin-antitoxin system